MTDSQFLFDPRAEDLFVEFSARRELGEPADFDELCRAHPEFAEQFRQLRSLEGLVDRLRSAALNRPSIARRLAARYGKEIDPGVSLGGEPKPDSDSQSKLFERLRVEGPRGTRYKLLGEVARGGMGAILKIWDEELRRTLAMKVVLGRDEERSGETPHVDPKTLGRFLEEAQITGQLDHPGIVPVHELGLDSTGRVYFTMKLVRGEDLRTLFEHVRSGHDGWNQVRVLSVLLRVCEAMAFAHSKQVIHRDLKPANVMVGKFGEVYVMDWGLARVLGQEDKHDLRLQPVDMSTASVVRTERHDDREGTPDSPLVTMDGDVVGTPSFMPPEQAKGQLDKVGPHSDVYSIGAMLYQLLTGEVPYVPAGARVSQHTILLAVLREAPPGVEKLAPSTPPELAAICEKAMAREIGSRYPTTLELAGDLRAYVEGRVVEAYETGAWAEARKWVVRNRRVAALAGGLGFLALLLVVITFFSLNLYRFADDHQQEARLYLAYASEPFAIPLLTNTQMEEGRHHRFTVADEAELRASALRTGSASYENGRMYYSAIRSQVSELCDYGDYATAEALLIKLREVRAGTLYAPLCAVDRELYRVFTLAKAGELAVLQKAYAQCRNLVVAYPNQSWREAEFKELVAISLGLQFVIASLPGNAMKVSAMMADDLADVTSRIIADPASRNAEFQRCYEEDKQAVLRYGTTARTFPRILLPPWSNDEGG